MSDVPALGKPASYGDFVLGRRMDLIDEMFACAREGFVARRGAVAPGNGGADRGADPSADRTALASADHGPYSATPRVPARHIPDGFRGGRLLDVGCGNGAQTVRLLDRFRHVVGLDVVRGHLTTFRREIAALDAANCSTVLYDGTRMPFRDGEFDAVLSIETLEHVRNEQQLLSEIHRVLRPEGMLVLSVPNKWWIFETHGANLPILPWNRVPFFSWLPPAIHGRFARARIYTRRGTERLLAAAGFQVLVSRYLAAPMDVIPNRALAGALRATIFRGPATRIPFLSTSIFVVARRPGRRSPGGA